MTIDESKIKIEELACYARTKGWDDEYTEAVNNVDKWLKELKAHREAWNKLKDDVVAYHNNYDYDTAMHFLNIIDTRLSEIWGMRNDD